MKNARALVGVYWGRFNPPHKGHMSVIKKLNGKYNLIVAVGSAEYKNERDNPFSGKERKKMVESYLKELKINNVRVVALNDGKGSMTWAIDNLIRRCKPDVLFLSNEKGSVIRKARSKVKILIFKRKGNVSSTLIRNRIAHDDESWRNLTGKSVGRLIVKLDGIKRIKQAYGI